MKRIAIFASGSGSNAENIIRYFNGNNRGAEVALVVCNRPGAGVLERASRLGVDSVVMSRDEINDEEKMGGLLRRYDVDIVVLAGFLLMVPDFLLKEYENSIVNIHPSLLPKFGGKGMYGRRVHEAVVASGEGRTGITIHYVNAEYDRGEIIFQASFEIEPTDSVDNVERKIHELEQRHFPEVIYRTFICHGE